MKITKMHGLGNDFIITEEYAEDYTEAAKRLCRRRLDVGADGLVALGHSDVADVGMRIINADGSEAEMCGNAIRCFARYVYDRGILRQEEMTVETIAGVMRPRLILEGGRVTGVRVDMGKPDFTAENIPVKAKDPLAYALNAGGREVALSSVLVGVPHAVAFGDWNEGDTARLGALIETDAVYPRRTNVDFTTVVDRGTLRVRTWERGAGETLACGTGCCAAAAVACEKGLCGRDIRVLVQPGELRVEYAEDGHIFMTGPAAYVFTGESVED
jgi:diaminopimelate epimerase